MLILGKQIKPKKNQKKVQGLGWDMGECHESFGTEEQIYCWKLAKEENYFSISIALTLNKSSVSMNLKLN